MGLGTLLFACLLHTWQSQPLILCQASCGHTWVPQTSLPPTFLLGDVPLLWSLMFSVPRLFPTTSYQTCLLNAASPGFKLLVARALWSIRGHAQHRTCSLTGAGCLTVYWMCVLVNEGSREVQHRLTHTGHLWGKKRCCPSRGFSPFSVANDIQRIACTHLLQIPTQLPYTENRVPMKPLLGSVSFIVTLKVGQVCLQCLTLTYLINHFCFENTQPLN